MKNFKYIFILLAGLLLSCSDEENGLISQIENSPNVAGFVESSGQLSGIANGTAYTFKLPITVFGPSVSDLSGDITVNLAVSSSSTAEEGVHFSLPSKSIVLTEAADYNDVIVVTMLTEGIETPLASNPTLIIETSAVTATGNVVASGKPISLDMLFLCPSYLEGQYVVTINRDDGSVYEYDDYITEIGDGQYRGQSVGHWAPGAIGGTPGFNFTDVCGVITVPQQNLVDLYSNQVLQAGDSYVDEETGNLHIEYTITSSGWTSVYVCDYVKQ